MDGKEIPVKIWDTAGQERFRTLTKAFYRRADGVVIAFSVTDKTSFQSLNTWIQSIQDHNQMACKILVGNKIDLANERTVTKE